MLSACNRLRSCSSGLAPWFTPFEAIEIKILAIYGRGMSYSHISGHVHGIYGISVSKAAINAMTDKIIDTAKA
jgi:transposase-like protein